MKEADDTLILSCFNSNAKLQSISINAESASIKTFTPNEFVSNLLKQEKGSYDERISGNDIVIKSDGILTMAWIPYVFYIKGKFSHCGIDLFSFIRENEKYKITNLVFNMRKSECKE